MKEEELLIKIYDFERKTMLLESENKAAKNLQNKLDSKNAQIKDLEKKVNQLNEEKDKVHVKNRNLETTFHKQLNENFFKSTSKVGSLQNELNMLDGKFKSFNRYFNYIRTLEDINIDLINEVKDMKAKFEGSLMLEHENYKSKLTEMNKNCLNLVRNMKIELQQNSADRINKSMKLLTLQNSLLYEELVKQSVMVEELMQKIKRKNDVIEALKSDVDVNKEVNVILAKNNKAKGIALAKFESENGRQDENNNIMRKSCSMEKLNKEEEIIVRSSCEGLKKMKNSSSSVIKGKKYQESSSRNTHFDSELQQSSKHLTSFKDFTLKHSKANSSNFSHKTDYLIDNLNKILKGKNFNLSMIDNIEDSIVKEILHLIYIFYKENKDNEIKNSIETKSNKKSLPLLDKFEKYLIDKSPKLMKFKIV